MLKFQHKADPDDSKTIMSQNSQGEMDHEAEEVHNSKDISKF